MFCNQYITELCYFWDKEVMDMVQLKNQTFIVDIKDNQNATWQGSLSWVQGNKKENFRSALELIKLIDSAIEKEQDDNNE